MHEPVHQVVDPVDEGVVGLVDWGPGVDCGKDCRGCGPSEVVIPFLGFADHVGGKDRSFFLLEGLVLL